MVSGLVDLIDYIPGLDEKEKVNKIWNLCRTHGNQVEAAIRRMREVHDNNLYLQLPENSFLQMIAERRHLRDPIQEYQQGQTMSSKSQPNGITVFYAYAYEDEELSKQLEKHLRILERQGIITSWHDRKISGGKEWEGEISEHLNTARIILLLISADFIDSDYCYDVEMKRALERHEAKDARVIPIILRPVLWKISPFEKLQAFPKGAKAVTQWEDQDEAFTDIVERIVTVVEELNQDT